MDIELIKAFYTLAEYKSFTKAADILCISQSALSHRIHVLEDELGMMLIDRGRGKKEFHLTPYGISFAPLATKWIALEKETQLFNGSTTVVRISVSNTETQTAIFSDFYRKLSADQSKSYSIQCSTFTYPSAHTLNEVESHNVDVGFTVRSRTSRGMKIEPIFREKMYLIGDLGTDKTVVDPLSLDPSKELLTDWYTEYSAWHNYYLGTDSRPFAILDTASMVINFMTEGIWCIVPECSVDFIQSNCALRGMKIKKHEMPSPPPDRTCYKVTNRYPRGDMKDALAYFESELDIYLKDRGLHL